MPFQDLLRYGVNTNQNLTPQGDTLAEGFLEGEARAHKLQDRARTEQERQDLADRLEREELDAQYGALEVPPSGHENYDIAVEMMARDWKKEISDLNVKKKNHQISNADYVQQEREIRNRAKVFKAGQQKLTEFASLYNQAAEQDLVSKSTPANIRLFADALNKGSLNIENVDGRPTVIGTTADGEKVNIDMAELASDRAPFRFNQKYDLPGSVDAIAKNLENYKTSFAVQNGYALGNVGWEQIQQKAAQDVDQILSSRSTLESIAADYMGASPEQIKATDEEELKSIARNFVLDQIQEEYFPTQKLEKFTGLTDAQAGNLALQRDRLNQSHQTGGRTNASLIKHQSEQDRLLYLDGIFKDAIAEDGDLRGLIGLGQIQNVRTPGYFGSKYTIETKNGNIKVDPANPADQQILKNLLGLDKLRDSGAEVEGGRKTPAELAAEYKKRKEQTVDPDNPDPLNLNL